MADLTDKAFNSYSIFRGIQLHFKQEQYDYFKYHGKIRGLTIDNFLKKPDRKFFYIISSKWDNDEDYTDFLVANFIDKPSLWVGFLVTVPAYNIYDEWLKRTKEIDINWEKDLRLLHDDFRSNFIVDPEKPYPYVLQLFFNNKITMETVSILMKMFDLSKKWDDKIIDPVIYPSLRLTAEKYYPFLKYDTLSFNKIFKERFDISKSNVV